MLNFFCNLLLREKTTQLFCCCNDLTVQKSSSSSYRLPVSGGKHTFTLLYNTAALGVTPQLLDIEGWSSVRKLFSLFFVLFVIFFWVVSCVSLFLGYVFVLVSMGWGSGRCRVILLHCLELYELAFLSSSLVVARRNYDKSVTGQREGVCFRDRSWRTAKDEK